MEKSVRTLYNFSLNKTAQLLMRCRRNADIPNNPFRAFHPEIVQDLMTLVCLKTTFRECLKSSHIYLLLTSGRIVNFKLDCVKIRLNDAEEIFAALRPWSEKLKSIKIRNVACVPVPWVSIKLGKLVKSATNLISLESTINFKLSKLYYCKSLEKLIINFVIVGRLCSFLSDGTRMRYNRSLRILRIFKVQKGRYLPLDIAKILHYCVEIVELDYDVTQSLMILHKQNLATKYKLQKTLLGDCNNLPTSHATDEAIRIASLYCPDLKVVDVSPTDYAATIAVSNFHEITSLTLDEPIWPNDDFHIGIRPLLEKTHFGHNLRFLIIKHYSDINFAIIGACCPKLEELRAEYISEDVRNAQFAPNSFQNLISLYLENIDEEPSEEASLIGILSNAPSLEFLTIRNAANLNDFVLDRILRLNTAVFSRLKTLTIMKSGLTIEGLQILADKLAQSPVRVLSVLFSSLIIGFNEAQSILVRALNLTLVRTHQG